MRLVDLLLTQRSQPTVVDSRLPVNAYSLKSAHTRQQQAMLDYRTASEQWNQYHQLTLADGPTHQLQQAPAVSGLSTSDFQQQKQPASPSTWAQQLGYGTDAPNRALLARLLQRGRGGSSSSVADDCFVGGDAVGPASMRGVNGSPWNDENFCAAASSSTGFFNHVVSQRQSTTSGWAGTRIPQPPFDRVSSNDADFNNHVTPLMSTSSPAPTGRRRYSVLSSGSWSESDSDGLLGGISLDQPCHAARRDGPFTGVGVAASDGFRSVETSPGTPASLWGIEQPLMSDVVDGDWTVTSPAATSMPPAICADGSFDGDYYYDAGDVCGGFGADNFALFSFDDVYSDEVEQETCVWSVSPDQQDLWTRSSHAESCLLQQPSSTSISSISPSTHSPYGSCRMQQTSAPMEVSHSSPSDCARLTFAGQLPASLGLTQAARPTSLGGVTSQSEVLKLLLNNRRQVEPLNNAGSVWAAASGNNPSTKDRPPRRRSAASQRGRRLDSTSHGSNSSSSNNNNNNNMTPTTRSHNTRSRRLSSDKCGPSPVSVSGSTSTKTSAALTQLSSARYTRSSAAAADLSLFVDETTAATASLLAADDFLLDRTLEAELDAAAADAEYFVSHDQYGSTSSTADRTAAEYGIENLLYFGGLDDDDVVAGQSSTERGSGIAGNGHENLDGESLRWLIDDAKDDAILEDMQSSAAVGVYHGGGNLMISSLPGLDNGRCLLLGIDEVDDEDLTTVASLEAAAASSPSGSASTTAASTLADDHDYCCPVRRQSRSDEDAECSADDRYVALRDLLLDSNLPDEVRRQAEVDRVASRTKMASKIDAASEFVALVWKLAAAREMGAPIDGETASVAGVQCMLEGGRNGLKDVEGLPPSIDGSLDSSDTKSAYDGPQSNESAEENCSAQDLLPSRRITHKVELTGSRDAVGSQLLDQVDEENNVDEQSSTASDVDDIGGEETVEMTSAETAAGSEDASDDTDWNMICELPSSSASSSIPLVDAVSSQTEERLNPTTPLCDGDDDDFLLSFQNRSASTVTAVDVEEDNFVDVLDADEIEEVDDWPCVDVTQTDDIFLAHSATEPEVDQRRYDVNVFEQCDEQARRPMTSHRRVYTGSGSVLRLRSWLSFRNRWFDRKRFHPAERSRNHCQTRRRLPYRSPNKMAFRTVDSL